MRSARALGLHFRLNQHTIANKTSLSGGTLSSYSYRLDADGRKVSDTETRLNNDGSTFSTTTITWSYDALSRLVSETFNDDPTPSATSADDYTAIYAYDAAGNRIRKTQIAGGGNEEIEYQYNSDNQLTREQTDNYDASVTSPVTTAAGLQYQYTNTYDNNGSLIQTKNAANTVVGSYVYDARNRISKTVGATQTIYVVDTANPSGFSQVLEEHQGMPVTSTFVIGLSGPISQNVGSTISFLVPDGHGSTRLLTTSTGAVTNEYDYDAFGNLLNLPSTSPSKPWSYTLATEYLYTDEPWDSTSLSYFLRGRPEYLPADGRFTTNDPQAPGVGDLGNANLYLYVGGNPLNMTDPSGREGIADLIVSLGIALNVVNFGSRVYSGINHFAHGQTNAGNQDFAWAVVDLLSLGLPLAGPGAALAGASTQTVATLSQIGLNGAALWGYLTTLFSVAGTSGTGGGFSGSGGTTPSSGSLPEGTWGKPPWYGNPSREAQLYQYKIASEFGDKPPKPSYEFWMGGIWWDGVKQTAKTFLEAKYDYAHLFEEFGDRPFGPRDDLAKQMRSQAEVARQLGYRIEAHFDTEAAAEVAREVANEQGVSDVVTVRTTPF